MKINKKESLFFIGVVFLLLKAWGTSSSILSVLLEPLGNFFVFFAYSSFLLSIILNKPSTKEIKIYGVLLFIGIMTYMTSKATAILTLFFTLISMKDIEVKKVIKFIFKINLFLLLVHILLYFIYMVFDFDSLKVIVRNSETGNVMRYSFFFVHPNVFAMYVFWTLAMFYYIYYEKIGKITYLTTILIAIFIYFFPNSRTCAIEIIMLVMLTVISKIRFDYIWLKSAFILISLFCTLSIFFINNPIIGKIDELLNTRISIGYIIYHNFGINVFGADIKSGTPVTYINGRYISSLTIIDSSYYSVLLNYGMLAYIIYIFLLYMTIKNTKFENDNRNKVMLFLYITYAMTETSCLSPILGFPLLLVSNVFKEKIWKTK